MLEEIIIKTENFDGEVGTITFFPDTGGTFNLGSQLLPYTYIGNYVFGTYVIYFSNIEKQCTLEVPNNLPVPTPTPTPTVTPTPTPTQTPTPTPTPTAPPTASPSANCPPSYGCGQVGLLVSNTSPLGTGNGLPWLNNAVFIEGNVCIPSGAISNDQQLLINSSSLGVPVNYSNPLVPCGDPSNPCDALFYPLCLCTNYVTPTQTIGRWVSNNRVYDLIGFTQIIFNSQPLIPTFDCSSECRYFRVYNAGSTKIVTITDCCDDTSQDVVIPSGTFGSPSETLVCSKTWPTTLFSFSDLQIYTTGIPCSLDYNGGVC